ncbi:MAG TPA: tetratricopeptide repeat protein [Anaerolineae bacterium]
MQTEPTPQFINAIAAAVEYWRRRTETLDDAAIARLDEERQNLYRAVEFGLKRAETWEAAAEVALQAFDLVERRGYWREWMPMLEAAVALCSEGQQGLKCRLLNRLGFFYRQDRRLNTAITMHREAEALALVSGNRQGMAEALFYLGGTYLQKREHAEAWWHGLEALRAFNELDNADRWLASTHMLLGIIARSRGDTAAAEAHLTEAVTRWHILNQPLLLARTFNELGNALWPVGKVDKAEACFVEATALLAPTVYEMDKAMILLSLGTLYFHQEQWDKAEAAFRQADSSYLRQSGHALYQAHVANNLGNVLLERGRPVEAEYYLRRALHLWQEADDDMLRANTLGTLGQALAIQGQISAALELYNQAIEQLHAFPDDLWARRLLQNFTLKRHDLMRKQVSGGAEVQGVEEDGD